MPKQSKISDAEADALQYGIDVNLLDFNLGLTYEERLRHHEGALAIVLELTAAREALHPEP